VCLCCQRPHQLRITVGQAIRDLELLATVYEPADMENR